MIIWQEPAAQEFLSTSKQPVAFLPKGKLQGIAACECVQRTRRPKVRPLIIDDVGGLILPDRKVHKRDTPCLLCVDKAVFWPTTAFLSQQRGSCPKSLR